MPFNFSSKALVKDIVRNGEGVIGMRGAAMVDTGIYTGRSPKDKYIVDEPTSSIVLVKSVPLTDTVAVGVFIEMFCAEFLAI